MKQSIAQTNFTAGEISPRLWAHVDINKYKNGLKTLRNARVLPHGPVVRRNGTKYVKNIKDFAAASRLIRFQYSQSNAYILEFGNNYIRFYKNGGFITKSNTIINGTFDTDLTGWTSIDSGTGSSSWSASRLLMAGGASGTGGRYQQISNLDSHVTYSITYTVIGNTTLVQIGTTAGAADIATHSRGVGTYTDTFTPPSNGIVYLTLSNSANNNATIDSISISPLAPYEITTTYTTAELFDISYAQFGKILYLFHPNHAPAQLVWESDTSWTLSDISFKPPATEERGTSGLGTGLTLASTAVGTGVTVTSTNSFFLAADVGRQIVPAKGFPGLATITLFTSTTQVNVAITTAFSSTTAGLTGTNAWKLDLSPITSVTPSKVEEGAISILTATTDCWRIADIGKYVLINNGVCKIISFTSVTVINALVVKALDALTASTTWSIEETAWDASTYGYPHVGTIHQQRLWMGSNTDKPQTVWATESGIYDSLGTGSRDTDALEFDISLREISSVSWMMGIRGQLAIGCSSGELTVDSGAAAGPITPASIVAQARGYSGSNVQQPVGLNDEVLYVQRSSRKLHAFRYDFQIDNYVSEDLLFLAEHLPGTLGIKEVAYAQDPDRTIYAVLNDGALLVCTYVREQEVLAWAKYTTDGTYESVNTISTGTKDEVWVIVKRNINGSTTRYIERFDSSDGTSNLDGFSDCYLTLSYKTTISNIGAPSGSGSTVTTSSAHGLANGDYIKFFDVGGMTQLNGHTYTVADVTSTTFTIVNTTTGANLNTASFTAFTSGGNVYKLFTTVSGLEHLQGETVQIRADGGVHTDKTVSSSSITLDRKCYEVTIGLPYETQIETLPPEFNQGTGTQIGQKSRWTRIGLRLYQSIFPLINGFMRPARTASDLTDNKVPLFTGDLIYDAGEQKEGFDNTLSITTTDPQPLMVLGLFGSIEGGQQ